MPNYFTHYWTNKQWELQRELAENGFSALDHSGSNQFRRAGVRESDVVFLITVKKGQLFLGGTIQVEKLCNEKEAERLLEPGYELYHANEHIIARTRLDHFRANRKVPREVVQKLYFEGPDGPKPPVFKSPGALDQQTLRGVRRLTTKAAEALERTIRA